MPESFWGIAGTGIIYCASSYGIFNSIVSTCLHCVVQC